VVPIRQHQRRGADHSPDRGNRLPVVDRRDLVADAVGINASSQRRRVFEQRGQA